MKKNNILYVKLSGRIGNQLFILATARRIQKERPDLRIVVDDSAVLVPNWVDSLEDYDLKDVEFVHDLSVLYKENFILQRLCLVFYAFFRKNMDYMDTYKFEKRWQKIFNACGLMICENGYMPMKVRKKGNIYMDGYFQSHKYFQDVEEQVQKDFCLDDEVENSNYPGLDLIKSRNSVCISIKVEHNVGTGMYDVCSHGYWEDAIKHITETVENPLFFVCSDNVDYVKEHLIDCSKYDVICQSRDYPVHISLAVMSMCKHFIIGNTTFGWWAQHLCKNKDKIVVVPSRWMRVEMPIDLYEDGWHLIDVKIDNEK